MSAFAIYRLPYEDCATLIRQNEGEPMELLSCQELNGKQGFVMAPFQINPSQPILLIRPDEVERMPLSHAQSQVWGIGGALYETPEPQSNYSIDFANYHAQLELGTFRKIVLARCANEETAQPIEPMELFLRACERYPRMFIALVSTMKSGCWLTATPEILLQSEGDRWRTIALAGTMKLQNEQLNSEGETVFWSTKNIQEQRIVSTYITECLEQFTCDFQEEGPRTVRAANLVHLRSDFTFSLPDDAQLGDLLHALHPTPAVCGLPKREAFEFIVHNEHTPRRYYSGFMGPIGNQTNLYVSLRCMNIDGCHYYLYAGGGLLKDSTVLQEWQETEAKLETMRSLLITKP